MTLMTQGIPFFFIFFALPLKKKDCLVWVCSFLETVRPHDFEGFFNTAVLRRLSLEKDDFALKKHAVESPPPERVS